jgi:transposase-like protein
MDSDRPVFRPPHCPYPECISHSGTPTWRYTRKGFFWRRARPQKIQRYVCHHCRRSFSSQTFSTTYFLKRPDLQPLVLVRGASGSAFRQIAFELGVAHSTLVRQSDRLGRHCLLLHEKLRPKRPPTERLVLDGFHSFEFGQYWPFEINLLVGHSHYVYGFQDAELRRSGRMSAYQRAKRQQLEERHGRPEPKATEKSVESLLTRHLPEGRCVRLSTDEHKAYPRVFKRLRGHWIEHDTTSSKARRTTRNPLFPVNRADLLIRHDGANHKRETIAFSKRRQGAMYRLAIWQVVRNYMKPTHAKANDAPPGVQIGAIGQRLGLEEVLGTRLFSGHFDLSGWLSDVYFARIPTRRLARCLEHRLKLAV